MIEKLEVGKLYVWVGPKKRPVGWNTDGYMDYLMDGTPHRCVWLEDPRSRFYPFGQFDEGQDSWSWKDTLENLVEVREEQVELL